MLKDVVVLTKLYIVWYNISMKTRTAKILMSFTALWLSMVSFGTAVSIAFADPSSVNPENIFADNSARQVEPADWLVDFDQVIEQADTLNLAAAHDGFMPVLKQQKQQHKAGTKSSNNNTSANTTTVHKIQRVKSGNISPSLSHGSVVLPYKIYIPALKKSLKVHSPSSTKISVLNKGLKKAVLRYPGTATLNESSRNMVIFGHSSHLPTDMVFNQMYRAFNGIEKLRYGRHIVLYGSDGYKYVYAVRSVRKVKASRAKIEINTPKKTLTLITCDNFGAKEDRWIVKSEFIRKYK